MNNITRKEVLPVVAISRTKENPLLLFLWRWKVSTTAALSRRFYPDRSAHAAYLRLWKLERAGFIKARVDESASVYMWTLDKKGFAAVRYRIPNMKEEGYLSENLSHDLLVTAIHLGDALHNPRAIEVFTEQELRRMDPEFFPGWVPKSKRRPDGYWRIPTGTGHKIVALEVELSIKADTEYESIARFYDEREEINQVLWATERPSMADKIHSIMKKISRRDFKHSFVLLDPIYTVGWQAPIYLGTDCGKTINGILENPPLTGLEPVLAQFLLDTRKTPHKSKHCELFRP